MILSICTVCSVAERRLGLSAGLAWFHHCRDKSDFSTGFEPTSVSTTHDTIRRAFFFGFYLCPYAVCTSAEEKGHAMWFPVECDVDGV